MARLLHIHGCVEQQQEESADWIHALTPAKQQPEHWKMVKNDLSDHVTFSLFKRLGFILSTTVSSCLCTGLGYKWFLNESSAKYQLCEAAEVQFCFSVFCFFFLRHWHRDADSIPRLLLGMQFCTVQPVSTGTVTYFSIVLALYSSKWTWNETITKIKVPTFSFKGV